MSAVSIKLHVWDHYFISSCHILELAVHVLFCPRNDNFLKQIWTRVEKAELSLDQDVEPYVEPEFMKLFSAALIYFSVAIHTNLKDPLLKFHLQRMSEK